MPDVTLEPGVDVLAVGITYRDLIMTGLPDLPRLGEERHAAALHETWGGISNMARVCRAWPDHRVEHPVGR